MAALRLVLVAVVVLFGAFVPGLAHAARTLAVLPLTQAAGSSDLEGLGDALAGMLVSDLSRSPELALVERARLDALLGEIDLGTSGFIEAGTAAELGRGVGAELVLVGTYSVVGETFLLDARLVEVESGSIRKGAAANGPLDDFVTVEKDLVEGLLDGLGVALASGDRRRMLSDSPTETLEALTAYGRGLAAERAGRLDAAKEAFARASLKDPRFTLAREGADRLARSLADQKAREAGAIDRERTEALNATIASTTGPTRSGPRDPAGVATLQLRWLAMADRFEDCAVAEEKLAWLDAVRWAWPIDRRSAEAAAYYGTLGAGEAQHARVPSHVQVPDRMKSPTASRLQLRSIHEFVGATTVFNKAGQGDRLVDNLVRCHGGAARVSALASLRDASRRSSEVPERGQLRVPVLVELVWAYQHADLLGPSAELQAALDRLMAVEREPRQTATVRSAVEWIGRTLEDYRRRTVSRGGASEATLLAFGRALVADEAGAFDSSRATCATLIRNERPRAALFMGVLDKDTRRGVRDSNLNGLGPIYKSFHRTGCLAGVPGVWPTFEDVLAGAREGLSRLDAASATGGCGSNKINLERLTGDAHLAQMKTWGDAASDQWIWAVLAMLHALEDGGCIDPLPLSPG